MFEFQPIRSTRKPLLGPRLRVDPSNPLARGMGLFTVLNEASAPQLRGPLIVRDCGPKRYVSSQVAPSAGNFWTIGDRSVVFHTQSSSNDCLFFPSPGGVIGTPTDLFNGVSALTVSTRLKQGVTSSNGLVGCWQSPSTQVGMGHFSDGNFYFIPDGSNYGFINTQNNTNWATSTMVYNGSQVGNSGRLRGWVNRVEQTLSYTGTISTTTQALNLANANSRFSIGGTPSGPTADCFYEYVAVWNRALSPQEVRAFEAAPYSVLVPDGKRTYFFLNGMGAATVKTISDSVTPTDSIEVSTLSPLVDLFPKQDTFRGGTQVWMHGSPKLVDPSIDSSFVGQTLPAGWTSSLLGTAQVRSSFNGTTLSTGPQAGSQAQLETAASYAAFSATLSVEPLTPEASQASEVDPLIFEFHVDSVSFAQIRVRRLPLVDSTKMLVDSVIGLQDGTELGGGLILPLNPLELQVVRHQNYLFLLVNGQLIAQTSRFRQGVLGSFRVTTANLSSATKVSTLITKLTLRSHALIGGRLIDGKVDFSERRVTGFVPASSLAEVGFTDIIVFGTWGFQVFSGAFEYTLAPGLGLGGQTFSPFTSYDDPVVHD